MLKDLPWWGGRKILETEVVDNFKKSVISNAAEQLLRQIDSDHAQDLESDKTPA